MKKILFFVCLLSGTYFANAQVGIGTPTPVTSAMLDIDSTDKGLLIPRIALTSKSVFLPITGTEVDGLLIFNTGTALDKGFYFWKDKKWNQVVDQANLEQTITNIVTGDIGEVKKIVDFLVPSNPKSGDKTLSQAALIIDPTDKKIYSVTYDEATKKYKRTDVEFQKLIQGLETVTMIKRSEVKIEGTLPDFTESSTAPVAKDTKIGEIYYQYLGENNKINYINLSSDVVNIIKNNETIKNEITNVLNQGGNVYYTEVAVGTIPANSLYQVNPDTKVKTIIDITANVFNSITENIEQIKNELGDKITNNVVINTGNKIDGDDVFLYKTTATITGAKASETDLTGKLPTGKKGLDRIISIKIYKDKKFVSDTITDVKLDPTNIKLNFNIGHGTFYLPLTTGSYEIIVEFTAK